MTDSDRPVDTDRRKFLSFAGAGAVAAGAAVAASPQAVAANAPEMDEKGGLYRETAHVKQVYDLARF
ncbi:MAG: twin-arginine translocation signal domain-containing protein [Pseudomonadota bacterium]